MPRVMIVRIDYLMVYVHHGSEIQIDSDVCKFPTLCLGEFSDGVLTLIHVRMALYDLRERGQGRQRGDNRETTPPSWSRGDPQLRQALFLSLVLQRLNFCRISGMLLP